MKLAFLCGIFKQNGLSVSHFSDLSSSPMASRRDFLRSASLSALAMGLVPRVEGQAEPPSRSPLPSAPHKPHRLPQGSTLSLITPASSISEEQFERALFNVQSLGYVAKYSPRIRFRSRFLAGSDEDRLSDLHEAFKDPSVDGIWCIRGGYGTMRLLDRIDYRGLRPHLKPLIGYSDITALHMAFYRVLNWVSFHGPMAASELTPYTMSNFKALFQGGGSNYELKPYQQSKSEEPAKAPTLLDKSFTIVGGSASGRLVGGNLTMLNSLLGTPYAPNYKGCIVFLEEIDERPYKVDRLLTQLLLSGLLNQAAGLVLGIFNDCEEEEFFDPSNPVFLESVLKERLSALSIPVLYGLALGHVRDHATLPIGVRAHLDADQKSLTLEENALI